MGKFRDFAVGVAAPRERDRDPSDDAAAASIFEAPVASARQCGRERVDREDESVVGARGRLSFYSIDEANGAGVRVDGFAGRVGRVARR